MCHTTSQWIEALPLVLLGIRSAWKENIKMSSAELVYGEPLHLPGQFLSPQDDFTTSDITQYASRLQGHIKKLTPKPASWHSSSPFYVPRNLQSSTHVFLRQDHVRASLEPPYAGPYMVVDRQAKYFAIDIKGKKVTVSVDRLNPAYIAK